MEAQWYLAKIIFLYVLVVGLMESINKFSRRIQKKPTLKIGMMKKMTKTLMMAAIALGLAACGGQKAAPAPKGIQYPEWVMKGSGAFGGEAGKVGLRRR